MSAFKAISEVPFRSVDDPKLTSPTCPTAIAVYHNLAPPRPRLKGVDAIGYG